MGPQLNATACRILTDRGPFKKRTIASPETEIQKMNMDPKEIQALLDATPDLPENAALISMLQSMLNDASIEKYAFTYNAVFWTTGAANNIAAGAQGTTNVQIDAGAPFLIVSQSYDANSLNAARAQATQVIPNAIVLMTDTGSSRTLMDVATPIVNIFGTGQFPYILPVPKLMQANSQLQVQVTNIDVAAGYNIRLSFNGFKLYRSGR
jgi:hypothetical protein